MPMHSIVSRRVARAVLLPLAAGALTAPLASVAVAQDGVTFTYRVQGTAASQKDRPSSSMVATVRLAGPNARLDFREGAMPMAKDGGYVLIRGAEKTMVIVNPKDRQAMVLGVEGLGAGAGALTNNPLVKISTRDQRFTFEDAGAGERVLGHATRRVKMSWGGATEMRMLGRKTTTTESSTGEALIAKQLAGVDAEALRGWSKAFGAGVRRTNPELARQMNDFDRQFGSGLVLRNVVVSTSTDDKGKSVTDTIRMEVTELSRAKLEAALFEVPKDYAVADMRQLGGAMDSLSRAASAAADSARAPGSGIRDTVSAKDVAKEAGKDAAQGAVKNALGGLLRRKKP